MARRLTAGGHQVTFFTTEHYRDRVSRPGRAFARFATDCDAHDLMVANPDREARRGGVRGVKADLRGIFWAPHRAVAGLMGILDGVPRRRASSSTPCSSARFPVALGPWSLRPALVTIGVLPLASAVATPRPSASPCSPGRPVFSPAQPRALNWVTEHVVLRDIQQLAHRRLAETGSPRFRGFFIDLPPKVADVTSRRRCRDSSTRARPSAVRPLRRADSGAAVDRLTRSRWWTSAREVAPSSTSPRARSTTPTRVDCSGRPWRPWPARMCLVSRPPRAGPRAPAAVLPANVRVERFIPHDLPAAPRRRHGDQRRLRRGAAALAHGVPLVVAGDSEDKPEVAARVRWSGGWASTCAPVGRRWPWSPAPCARVLSRPSYRVRAQALQSEIAASDPLAAIGRDPGRAETRRETARQPVAD